MRSKVISTIIAVILIGLLIWLGYIIYKRNKDANEAEKMAQELTGPILGQIDEGAAVDDRRGTSGTSTPSNASDELGINTPPATTPQTRFPTTPSNTRVMVDVDGVRLNIPRNFQYIEEGNGIFLYNAAGTKIGMIEVAQNLFNRETIQTQEDTLDRSSSIKSKSRGTLAGKRALFYRNNNTRSAIITTDTNIYFISGSLADPSTRYLNKVN